MLLRDSEYKGSSTFANAASLAGKFKGEDLHGHRAEFIRLVGVAEGVRRLHAAGN
jgi:Ca-activated chloride channel homolog